MIKKYSEFNTIHIFDFDDTIVKTPKFEDTIYKFLIKEDTSKKLLDKSLKFINKDIKDLKWEHGRIFIPDPEEKIKIKGNWVRKKSRVYLTSPNMFTYIDESLPKSVKKISKLYNSVDNKCILTARPEPLRHKIIETLTKLKLNYPKFGIFMRPKKRMNAGQWKGEQIVEIAKKFKFKKVIFYEDNSKYIKKAKKVVNKELPNLDLVIKKMKKSSD